MTPRTLAEMISYNNYAGFEIKGGTFDMQLGLDGTVEIDYTIKFSSPTEFVCVDSNGDPVEHTGLETNIAELLLECLNEVPPMHTYMVGLYTATGSSWIGQLLFPPDTPTRISESLRQAGIPFASFMRVVILINQLQDYLIEERRIKVAPGEEAKTYIELATTFEALAYAARQAAAKYSSSTE